MELKRCVLLVFYNRWWMKFVLIECQASSRDIVAGLLINLSRGSAVYESLLCQEYATVNPPYYDMVFAVKHIAIKGVSLYSMLVYKMHPKSKLGND